MAEAVVLGVTFLAHLPWPLLFPSSLDSMAAPWTSQVALPFTLAEELEGRPAPGTSCPGLTWFL